MPIGENDITSLRELVVTPTQVYAPISSDDMKFNLEQAQASANARNKKASYNINKSMNKRIHPYFSEVTQAGIGSLFPWTNLAMGAYYAGDAMKNIKQNGLNLGNSTQLALAGLPFAAPVKRTVDPMLVPIKKRAIEVAMRTTGNANPTRKILRGIKSLDSKRAKAIGKYILSGKTTGNKGYYNSLALNPDVYYSGFGFRIGGLRGYDMFPYNSGNDAIDVFLYQRNFDPVYKLKKVATGSDFGPHNNYITKNYSKKAKDIPVYEFEPDYHDENIGNVVSLEPWKLKNDRIMIDYNDVSFNANGHLYQQGQFEGEPVIRLQDIWKFNPEDYSNRYGISSLIGKWGLKKVNKYGTPFIIRTPWSTSFRYSYR